MLTHYIVCIRSRVGSLSWQKYFARTVEKHVKTMVFNGFADGGSATSHKCLKSKIISCDLGYICTL